MKILIACEYSGVVRDAFIARGHNAISCDIEDTEAPGPHYKGNVFDILYDGWDMMIAHPPCTHLAASGARWFKDKQQQQVEALKFVNDLLNAPIDKIALENPVGVISSQIRKPDQIVQPYWFGDSYKKTTCLWLKNLPKLEPTDMVHEGEIHIRKSGRRYPAWLDLPPSADRGKIRSKTFPGFAQAMAEQWG